MRTEVTLRRLHVLLGTLTRAKKDFNMQTWGEEKFDWYDGQGKARCGTAMCLAGHMSLDPYFRRRAFVGTWDRGTLRLLRTNPATGKAYAQGGSDHRQFNWVAKVAEVLGVSRDEADFLTEPGDVDRGGATYPADRRGVRARIYYLIRFYRGALEAERRAG